MNNIKTTILRLNRLFNIFNPKVYRWLLVINAILLAVEMSFVFTNKHTFFEFVLLVLTVNIAVAPSMLLHCPKAIIIHKDFIQFEDYVNMIRRYAHVKGFKWLKVKYSVSEIKDVELHQNFVEKFFDVGHISFSGKATFTAKRDMDKIRCSNKFTIYGIKNFSQYKLEITL